MLHFQFRRREQQKQPPTLQSAVRKVTRTSRITFTEQHVETQIQSDV